MKGHDRSVFVLRQEQEQVIGAFEVEHRGRAGYPRLLNSSDKNDSPAIGVLAEPLQRVEPAGGPGARPVIAA